MVNIRAYTRLIRLEATSPMSGGIFYFLGGYFVHLVRTLLLLSIWRAVLPQSNASDQLGQVLRYTLVAGIFWQQIDVVTTASTTFWEGTASVRFLRPLNVFGQYMSETIGKWIPGLLFFSMPLILLSPELGVDLRPLSLATLGLFTGSLLLGIMSGFALDFILTGLMVYMGNANYIAVQIRNALTMLLSGALIPLYLLPFGIGKVLEWLPFATMAAAPLSIYTGTAGDTGQMILLQVVWCIILWTLAMAIWKMNRQKLVVFGG